MGWNFWEDYEERNGPCTCCPPDADSMVVSTPGSKHLDKTEGSSKLVPMISTEVVKPAAMEIRPG